MTVKKWLALALAITMIFGLVGTVGFAQDEYPAAPAIAAELLRDAGVEQLGPYVSAVARETKGRNATFLGLYEKDHPEYRNAVRDFILGLDIVFCPSYFGGLQLWLDATDFVGNNPNDQVEVWQDKSGNEYHASQSRTDRIPSVSSDNLNGLPLVSFNNDYLSLPDQALGMFREVDGVTVITVARYDSVTRRQALFFSNIATGDLTLTRVLSGLNGTSGFEISGRREDSDTNKLVIGGTPYADTWYIQTGILDHAKDKAEIFINGSSVIGTEFHGEGYTSDTNSRVIGIGNSTIDRPVYFVGDIAEIIVFNRALSSNERRAVENYLADKYSPAD